VWASVTGWFAAAWTWVKDFFVSVWNNIVSVVMSVANWFGGVWASVTGSFAAAWTWIKDLFTSVWDSIKGVVRGFVEWLSPVIDAILAPFKAIGNVIGGIVGAVKGWFGETVDIGNTELARMNQTKAAKTIIPETPASASPVAAPITAPDAASMIAAPAIVAPVTVQPLAPAPGIGGAASQTGNNDMLFEHLAAARRKGVAAQDVSTFASDAFMGAGAAAVDFDAMMEAAQVSFAEAMPRQTAATVPLPWDQKGEREAPRSPSKTINVQNVYLQADDCKSVFDLMRLFEQIAYEPAEAAV
jgi:hypothetical protein